MSELINAYKQAVLSACNDMAFQENVKTSAMTSFKIGGVAPLVIRPETTAQMMICR